MKNIVVMVVLFGSFHVHARIHHDIIRRLLGTSCQQSAIKRRLYSQAGNIHSADAMILFQRLHEQKLADIPKILEGETTQTISACLRMLSTQAYQVEVSGNDSPKYMKRLKKEEAILRKILQDRESK